MQQSCPQCIAPRHDRMRCAARFVIVMSGSLLLSGAGCAVSDLHSNAIDGNIASSALSPRTFLSPAVVSLHKRQWENVYASVRWDGHGSTEPIQNGRHIARLLVYDEVTHSWVVQISPDRTQKMQFDRAGNLAVTEVTDTSHDARTVYDPPLIVLYANQYPTKVYEQSDIVATTWSIKHPERRDDVGTVRSSVEYVGEELIPWALGSQSSIAASRVDLKVSIDFRRADVETIARSWYVESVGLALLQKREQVRVLGPLGWTTETTLQLIQQDVSPEGDVN